MHRQMSGPWNSAAPAATPRRRWRALGLAIALLAPMIAVASTSPAQAEYGNLGNNAPWVTDGGPVHAIARIGNRVYVGGEFNGISPTVGGPVTGQANLFAMGQATGAHDPVFAPQINGNVRALTPTADGSRLLVGGDFTTVNGQSRSYLVALDPTTGALDPTFTAQPDNSVWGIEVDGDDVYFGGQFTFVNARFTGRASRAGFSTDTVDYTWKPRPDRRIESIQVPPSGGRVYLAGRFRALAGNSSYNELAAVDMNTGAPIASFDPPVSDRAIEIEATDDLVYTAHGDAGSNWFSIYRASNGDRIQHYNGNGDFTSVEIIGDRVFAGSHSTRLGNIDKGFIAAVNADDGTFNSSFDTPAFSPDGIFALYGSGRNLWAGGDLHALGGRARDGIGRLSLELGAQAPTNPSNVTATANGAASVTVSWGASSDDGAIAGYRVLKGGEQIAFVSGTSFVDTNVQNGVTYQYHVEAFDTEYNPSNRSGAASVLVGATADTIEPDTQVSAPVHRSTVTTNPVAFAGTITDNQAVASVEIAIRNTDTGLWLQPGGGFGSYTRQPASLSSPGAASSNWTFSASLPNGAYAIQSTGFDAAGNRETARPWIRFTVDAAAPTEVLFLQAETGTLFGNFQLFNDGGANGGQAVGSPSGLGADFGKASGSLGLGRAELTFTVDTPGNFVIRGRHRSPSGSENSFYVQVAGQEYEWHAPSGSTSYVDTNVTDGAGSSTAIVVPLSTGTHTVSFVYRENNTRLDEVELVRQ